MGERKVLSKYYPPDFDPSKLPRIKKPRGGESAVRFMLPMSVRCETCGEFMGTGLKFNAKKTDTDEDYLGVKIYRFYMKCKACPATFTIKTDPQNSDYVCESGVKRNYQPWKAAEATVEEAKDERSRQDEDVIQALENKTMDAKQEMEDLDALDELKTLKAKQSRITADDVLALRDNGPGGAKRDEADAEQLMLEQAKLAFSNKRSAVHRVGEGGMSKSEGRSEGQAAVVRRSALEQRNHGARILQSSMGLGLSMVRPKKKAKTADSSRHGQQCQEEAPAKSNALSGLAKYGGTDSSDDD